MIQVDIGVRSIRLIGRATIQCNRIFPSQMEWFIRTNGPLLSEHRLIIAQAIVRLNELLADNLFTLDAFGNVK